MPTLLTVTVFASSLLGVQPGADLLPTLDKAHNLGYTWCLSGTRSCLDMTCWQIGVSSTGWKCSVLQVHDRELSMPASRVTFAIGDLMNEIRRLVGIDAEVKVALQLDADSYQRVKREIGHHYGQPLTGTPIACADRDGLEFIKIGGMMISNDAA